MTALRVGVVGLGEVAQVVHLPILESLPDLYDLTATGFRDTTRIAASDGALWSAIFQANREKVLAALAKYATRGKLWYPPEVCGELEDGEDAASGPDFPLVWVRNYRHCAERKRCRCVRRRGVDSYPSG